jgi:prepilin-type N-terminal cleavage/methylation domain-containing protein
VSNRRGFTFIEMMMVLVIAGLVYAIVVKPVRGAFVAASRRAATREVTSYLFRARTIGIQQSRRAWLVRSGDALKIIVDSSGTKVQVGTIIDMNARYGATLTATPKDSIEFDPRGFVVLPASTPKLIVAQTGGGVDTLCVSGLGRIAVQGC